MPAIPIADSSAPIVVGISDTSSAISVAIDASVDANSANGLSVTTTARNTIVRPASRMPSAISFGVLRRSAPSTSAIIWSRKLLPGSWVISTTMRSDSTRVPPVTALRSPPDSRTTGADSPVIADSSTDAMPSTTVPSPGISSPASTTTRSPLTSSAPTSRRRRAGGPRSRCAWREGTAAWALPRPSASASARLPKTTVSHSHTATVNVNQAGSSPPPSGSPPKAWISQPTVVMSAPTSTTNITGLRTTWRGSSLRRLSTSAGRRISVPRRTFIALLVQRQVQFEDVHAGLAEHAEGAAIGVLLDQLLHARRAAGCAARPRGGPGSGRCPRRCAGPRPDAVVCTASSGTSPGSTPSRLA